MHKNTLKWLNQWQSYLSVLGLKTDIYFFFQSHLGLTCVFPAWLPTCDLPAIRGSQNLHLTFFCIRRQIPKSQEIPKSGILKAMFTWRWCCCERRSLSPRRQCLPSQPVAWYQTWLCTHQRRPGSSTPLVQTCPARHLCTWASPSPCRPGDKGLNTYSLWQEKLPTHTSVHRFIQHDMTEPRAVLCTW